MTVIREMLMVHKFSKLCINDKTTVKFAMKKIQETSKRVLFIVDEAGRLAGTINDGDIRRWILKRGDLNSVVKKAYNKNPLFIYAGYDINDVKKLMLEHWAECIPVLGNDGKIKDVLYFSDIFGQPHIIRHGKLNVPVVIMAGGQGKRLDPFTRVLPKPLIPIGEKPIVEVIMDNFLDYNCKKFYMLLNYKADMIRAYFDGTKFAKNIKYIYEDFPYGTAGGLQFLPKGLGRHIFISNCDMVIKADYSDIYNFHLKNNNDITIVSSMRHFKVPYGVIELNEQGRLLEIVEKPEHDHLVNTGMYLIKKDILSLIPKDKKQFHFTHLIKKVLSRKGHVGVYPISEKSWLDIGQWEEYWKNIKYFGA